VHANRRIACTCILTTVLQQRAMVCCSTWT
jgi:hypothetical protein